MTGDPFGVGRIHDGLTGWTDGDRLVEVGGTIFGDPGHLRCEALDMILFSGQGFL